MLYCDGDCIMKVNQKLKQIPVKPSIKVNAIVNTLLVVVLVLFIWFLLSWCDVIANNLKPDTPLHGFNLFNIFLGE